MIKVHPKPKRSHVLNVEHLQIQIMKLHRIEMWRWETSMQMKESLPHKNKLRQFEETLAGDNQTTTKS